MRPPHTLSAARAEGTSDWIAIAISIQIKKAELGLVREEHDKERSGKRQTNEKKQKEHLMEVIDA